MACDCNLNNLNDIAWLENKFYNQTVSGRDSNTSCLIRLSELLLHFSHGVLSLSVRFNNIKHLPSGRFLIQHIEISCHFSTTYIHGTSETKLMVVVWINGFKTLYRAIPTLTLSQTSPGFYVSIVQIF